MFSYVLVSTNHLNDGSGDSGNTFHANGSSMIDMITKMYRIFTTFYGSISSNLNGYYHLNCDSYHINDDENLKCSTYTETIQEVKATRKVIRKCNLRQKSNRAEYASTIRSDENNRQYLDLHCTKNSIEQIKLEIENTEYNTVDAKQRLEVLLASPYYAVGITRLLLRRFVNWYVQTGELVNPSAAHSMSGMPFLQVGHPTFQALIQTRQALDIGTGNRNKGSLMTFDGQVIWSDLDDDIGYLLYDFIRIIEYETTRNILVSDMKDFIGDGVRRDTSDRDISKDIRAAEEQWHKKVLTRKGFVTDGWGVVDFDDYSPTQVSPEVPSPVNVNTFGGNDVKNTSETFLSSNSTGLYNIWSPRIHGQKELPRCKSRQYNNSDLGLPVGNGDTYCIGRALIFRQHKFIVVTILPEVSVGLHGGVTNSGTLHEICGSLQRGMSHSLEKLGKALNEQQFANNSEQRRKSTQIPDGVRLIYYNGCNRAVKTADIFRWQTEPLTIWPTSIWEEIVTSPASRLHKTASSPDDLNPRSSCMSYTTLVQHSLATSLILSDGRCRFPLPPPLASACIEPALARALNEARETLSDKYCRGCSVTECCVRVSSQRRGGMWVLARRLRNRHIYVIIEGKVTMLEMYEIFLKTSETLLSQVII